MAAPAVRRARLRGGYRRGGRRPAGRHQGIDLLLLPEQGRAGHGGHRDPGRRLDRAAGAAAGGPGRPGECAAAGPDHGAGDHRGHATTRPRWGCSWCRRSCRTPQRARIKELRRRHDQVFRSVIEEGVASGEFTVTSVDTALRCMHAAMSQAPVWCAGLQGQRLAAAVDRAHRHPDDAGRRAADAVSGLRASTDRESARLRRPPDDLGWPERSTTTRDNAPMAAGPAARFDHCPQPQPVPLSDVALSNRVVSPLNIAQAKEVNKMRSPLNVALANEVSIFSSTTGTSVHHAPDSVIVTRKIEASGKVLAQSSADHQPTSTRTARRPGTGSRTSCASPSSRDCVMPLTDSPARRHRRCPGTSGRSGG